ncbi:TPA: DUF1302 domain-containing protein [Pseudomonas aeruginosa]
MKISNSFRKSKVSPVVVIASGYLLQYAPASHAVLFDLGNGISGSFDSTLSVATQIRTQDPSCRFVAYDNGGCPAGSSPGASGVRDQAGMINMDDGNLNYKKGKPLSTTVRGVHDLYVKAPDDVKVLVRAAWFKDYSVTHTERTSIEGEAHDDAVSDIELLDAYVDKGFQWGEQSASIRVGNQVINWGEALLTQGGINEANPLDVRKATSAGVQLKELYIPRPMISLSSSLTDKLGMQVFYELGFKPSTLPASGTFFSTADLLGAGGRALYLGTNTLAGFIGPGAIGGDNGTIDAVTGRPLTVEERLTRGFAVPRGKDMKPGSDQFGVSMKYAFDSGDELGLYYMRYHEKLPMLSYVMDSGSLIATNTGGGFPVGSYAAEYVGNRDVFGASYNFKLGDFSWGIEAAYRPKQAIAIDPTTLFNSGLPGDCAGLPDGAVCHGYVDTKKWQTTASGMQLLQPSSWGGLVGMLGANNGVLLLEMAAAYYPDLDLRKLQDPLPAAPLNTTLIPYSNNIDFQTPTKSSGGVASSVVLNYTNAFGSRVTLSPEVAVNQGLWGIAAQAMPGFSRGTGQMTTALTVDFKTDIDLKARVDYTRFYGGGDRNLMKDRDYVGLSLTSSF